MKCVFLVCLLLQAVCAAKNITLSIDVPRENPADVSYVEGKAPEELKAGPVKNTTTIKPKAIIAQAAFIRSSNREIPKDDEIENEEFERFIQKYHSQPTIETVFVSTSPSPTAEDSEEFNEETNTNETQVEVFKRPSAKLQTFERSVAHPDLTSHILPAPEHHPTYAIVGHQPHDASLHHAGSASFAGSDGYIFQTQGGAAGNEGLILQSNGGHRGQIFLTDGSGGEQQYYQYADFVPRTFNVAQNAVKTKTYEIRRPAIQRHYYDIEERVIVRPAGSVIVELDRPVAKVPTGETVVAVGGLTGSFVGNGYQQSTQGGISFANAFGINGGGAQGGLVGIQQSGGDYGLLQGGLAGSGLTFASSVGAPSLSGSIGGFQQSQGSIGGGQGGIGIQQSQGAIGGGQGGIGIQQSQAAIGGGQGGIGIQQSQGAIGGGQGGIGIQQSQGGIGGGQGGIGIQQSQGGIGGGQGGIGIQQSQSGLAFSTTTPSPNGSPSSTTVVIGTQQQQGAVGGAGFQQSQSGIAVTTTPAPSVTQTLSTAGTLFGGANGGLTGIGVQQSQGGIGISQGGTSGSGFQQSQSGVTISTTPAPGNGQASSTTNIFVGRGVGGVGYQGNQGGVSYFEGGGVYPSTGTPLFQSSTPYPSGGGFSGIGFQQSQSGIGISQGGGVTSTTGAPFFQSTTPFSSGGGYSGIGIQQSQSGIGISQGGDVTSTTGVPFFPSTTPLPNGGGFSGIGFQQSHGGISQNGGTIGAGFQQSQGGIYSTTPAPYLPPAAPTPTVLIGRSNGGFSGAGFQQSQGGIGLGGSQGGLAGAGFQQSQGGIGLSQGGGFAGFQQSQGGIGLSQGDLTGAGFQQSQGSIGLGNGGSYGGGEFIYSTTSSSPSYSLSGSRSIILRQQPGGSYPVVSTTTGGPIIISTLNQQGHNGNSFIIQGNSNVQSKGSVSTTTTTERSFTVNQGTSAYAKGGSSGSIQAVSKNITPYKIAVGEPDFSYPSYVEITSNGSPLGHLTQQSYVQAPSPHYPRMRYQGQLLTGEVHVDDGLTDHQGSQHQGYGALSSHHQNYEIPTHVAETTTSSPQEEHSSAIHQSGFTIHDNLNSQNQHQFVGSSKQPVQVSQISSSSHQQPDQVYQHNIPRPISEQVVEQHASQQNSAHQLSSQHNSPQQQIHHRQHVYPQQSLHQYFLQEQQPNHQRRGHQQHSDLQFIPITPINQEQEVNNKQRTHPNLVAQIRHQEQLTQKQPSLVQINHQHTEHHPTENTHSKQQQASTEALEEPVEVSDIHSSTHQQPTLFQQQVTPTINTLEPYSSGRRQYKQRGAPSKYTQDQSLNSAQSEHTVYFNNNLEHTSARSQNIEIPPEPLVEETSAKNVESTTPPIAISSTTTTQRIEETTQPQRQTYASVLAQGNPGILYAPPSPVVSHHSHGHKQHFLRFSADGSSLFSPSGRQLHLVYSDLPQPIYPHHQSQAHSIPALAPIEPAKQHISVTNKGYQIQAQLPITSQNQIQLNASNKPAPASEPQITRSQSHAESHRTSARYEAISSTTPETVTAATKEQRKLRGPQKYRNEQTHGAITLRSGRTYGDHRVIASTPAPSDGGAASESVQTRRIVVNHPFQTVQEVVEREPFTNIHQVTVNAPAKQVLQGGGLQEGQQKSAALRAPAPYKVAALLNHPQATLSFHHGGSH